VINIPDPQLCTGNQECFLLTTKERSCKKRIRVPQILNKSNPALSAQSVSINEHFWQTLDTFFYIIQPDKGSTGFTLVFWNLEGWGMADSNL
jgi:hypothetical protein